MKANYFLAMLLFAGMAVTMQSCLKDKCQREVSYIRIDPVFKSVEEIHNGTAVVEAPRALRVPGQIYFYNNLIFINEKREGIHVIDNADPANPQNISFISIPGNEDLAIRNGVLYANTYIDLLAIELSNYEVVGRVESVFPPLWEDVQNNRVAVYYQETPITEEMDCETFGTLYKSGGVFFEGGPEMFDDLANVVDNSSGSAGGSSGTGIGGSMARFTLASDHLYIIDDSSLKVFDLSQPQQPSLANTVGLGWGIETIFPFEDKLFIGSNSGMFIFDNSNPAQPTMLSAFAHARACDPVFVKDDYAYVTLRSGSICEGFNNQLDLIDITNITTPVLVKSFPMDNPHGLSIKNNDLLLCEGDFGLKSFDVTDPRTLGDHLLDHENNIHAFDVIALPGQQNVALVIGEDGFYQYNFDDPADLKLL
ncbi:MAG: LVIVD repeat-containing protein, partial [Saprospiraceae bacterium]